MFAHSGVDVSNAAAEVKFLSATACHLIHTSSREAKYTVRHRTVCGLALDRGFSFPQFVFESGGLVVDQNW